MVNITSEVTMNMQLPLTQHSAAGMSDKSGPIALLKAMVSGLMGKKASKASEVFWQHTNSMAKTDISSFKGIL
jgi:hypothetical protein